MDVGKLKGLTIGDLVARAQALGEKLEPDNPDFADNLALSLVKSVVHGTEDLGPIIDLFGSDDDISGGLFPDDTVSVTETSVSLPKDTELSGETTPEEEQMLDETINPEEDDMFAQILNANTDEELQAALGITGDNKSAENSSAENSSTDEPPADFSDTNKTSAEEAADKSEEPKEDKPAEPKPEEDKPAESKSEEKKEEKVPEEEKPKEISKDESDDTMKNITSALSDRF